MSNTHTNSLNQIIKDENGALSQPDMSMRIMSFVYFSVSNISRMLEFVGIRREITYVIYILFFLHFVYKHVRKLSVIDLIYYALITVVVSTGLINYGGYINARINVYAILILFYPSYLFFRYCNVREMYDGFRIAMYFSVIYLLSIYFLDLLNIHGYSMDYGTWVLMPTIACFYFFLVKYNVLDLILFLVLSWTLLLSANRSALLWASLSFLYLLYVVKDFLRYRFVKWSGVVALVGIFALNYNSILSWLAQTAGDKSRNIRLLVSGNLFSSASRISLYDYCSYLIEQKPFGYGPLASRMLITGHPYPHSLFLELQLDFGKYIGIIIFVVIIYMALTNLYTYRFDDVRVIVCLVSVIGIGSLMLSSSYYYENYIPATVALFLQSFVTMKRHKIKASKSDFIKVQQTGIKQSFGSSKKYR